MKLKASLLLSAILASAVLAGCGGGGGSDTISSPPAAVATVPPPTIANSVGSLIAYMQNLIATATNDTSEPIDINNLQLATDDMAEPSAI